MIMFLCKLKKLSMSVGLLNDELSSCSRGVIFIAREQNMPGVGVGCSRIEQDGEDDALDILKSFMESEEITSTNESTPLEKNHCFDPFSPDLNLSSAEDQLTVKSDSVVHSGETDSSDEEYSDYGRTLKKMLVQKEEQCERERLPAASTSSWRKGAAAVVSAASHVKQLPQLSSDVSTESLFGIRVV
jgi:hypothetical protein